MRDQTHTGGEQGVPPAGYPATMRKPRPEQADPQQASAEPVERRAPLLSGIRNRIKRRMSRARGGARLTFLNLE